MEHYTCDKCKKRIVVNGQRVNIIFEKMTLSKNVDDIKDDYCEDCVKELIEFCKPKSGKI